MIDWSDKITDDEYLEWQLYCHEKADKCDETLLAFYFEPRICPSCIKMTIHAVLRTRTYLQAPMPTGERAVIMGYIKQRWWCTECKYMSMPARTEIRSKCK